MPDSTFILLMDQILGYRREFYRHANADELFPFNDIDAITARFVLSQFKMGAVQCADAAVSVYFSRVSLPDGCPLSVSPAHDASLLPSGSPFNLLALYTPQVLGLVDAVRSLPPATTLMLCYGLHSPMTGEFVHFWNALPFAPGEAFFLPLYGQAPGLWRSASCLVCHVKHRAILSDTMRPLLAASACADFDPLHLAEENASLRQKITHLTDPSASLPEQKKLQEELKKLRTENTSLRQTLLQQERTIAAIEKREGQLPASPAANR